MWNQFPYEIPIHGWHERIKYESKAKQHEKKDRFESNAWRTKKCSKNAYVRPVFLLWLMQIFFIACTHLCTLISFPIDNKCLSINIHELLVNCAEREAFICFCYCCCRWEQVCEIHVIDIFPWRICVKHWILSLVARQRQLIGSTIRAFYYFFYRLLVVCFCLDEDKTNECMNKRTNEQPRETLLTLRHSYIIVISAGEIRVNQIKLLRYYKKCHSPQRKTKRMHEHNEQMKNFSRESISFYFTSMDSLSW